MLVAVVNLPRIGSIFPLPQSSKSTVIIDLKDSGFSPNSITIQPGTKVVFTTSKGSYFWPASDVHPTHTLYPEFDPKRPIGSKESWSFVFTKEGAWKFHDHLSPYFTGTITVTKSTSTSPRPDQCPDSSTDRSCWKEALTKDLFSHGLDYVYDEVASLYSNNSNFPGECHSLAHDLGIASYKLYLQDKNSVISAKSAYCANGFYHGFMEAFLGATKDIDAARKFCAFVDQKISSQAPDAYLQCFHGIGHGSIELFLADVELAKTAKDELSIINPALNFCDQASKNSSELYRCASGVFNGLANFYINSQYNLKVNKDNPTWVCDQEDRKYQDSCYGNMNSLFFWLAQGDFAKSMAYLYHISDNEIASSATRYLAGLAALGLAKSDPAKAIAACRATQPRLYDSCIQGFAHGLLEHGTPGVEYKDAFNFCGANALLTTEKDLCFHFALSNLNGWYPISKVKEICGTVDEIYRKYCPS